MIPSRPGVSRRGMPRRLFGTHGPVGLPGQPLDTLGRPGQDRGMVTAELALGLIWVVALLGAVAWLGGVVLLQLRVTDVAAEIARHQARGDIAAVAALQARSPEGARFSVSTTDEVVQVMVTVPVRPLGMTVRGFEVTGRAATVAEPAQR